MRHESRHLCLVRMTRHETSVFVSPFGSPWFRLKASHDEKPSAREQKTRIRSRGRARDQVAAMATARAAPGRCFTCNTACCGFHSHESRNMVFGYGCGDSKASNAKSRPTGFHESRNTACYGFHEPRITKRGFPHVPAAIPRTATPSPTNRFFTKHETRDTNHGFYAFLPTISQHFPAIPGNIRPPPPPNRSRVRPPSTVLGGSHEERLSLEIP